jgi:molybdopterin converting factor small subunit
MTITVLAEDMLPAGQVQLEAQTVGEAAQAAGLARRTGLVILVNGRLADWQTRLADGDVVEFVPALGGG